VTRVVDEIEDGARNILAFGPYTHGNLVRGLQHQIQYGPYIVTARIGISGRRFPYAASVEKGATAHPIRPRQVGGRLIFYWRKVSHVVSLKEVRHPGQTGKAYLRIPLLVVTRRYNFQLRNYDL
jgi:hypothetical protein